MTVTEQLEKTKESVVTDMRPTDANANVAVGREAARFVSPEAALLFNKSVVAKPLMTPEVCSIRIKNSEYRYRWVNFSGQAGRVYQMRKSQGFTDASPEDVDVLGGDAAVTAGTIRAGDLILMKIRADLYDAAIKWNMQKAATMQRMRGVYNEGGSSDVMSDDTPRRVSVSNEPFTRSGQATPFIPSNPDAIVNDSVLSGRIEDARKAVKDLGKGRG